MLEHPFTVGDIAFDRKDARLAIAHHSGVILWSRETWMRKSSSLIWMGSHVDVTRSPDDRVFVTAMEENACHD